MSAVHDGRFQRNAPIDHVEQSLHQVGQVGHLSALIREDGAMHGGQLGQALKGILRHVWVLSDLPVHLQDRDKYTTTHYTGVNRSYFQKHNKRRKPDTRSSIFWTQE